MKFGVMYDFRNPKQWRRPYPELYAAMIESGRDARRARLRQRVADRASFCRRWVQPSVLPTAAAIAMRTKKIRIGTFVLLLPFHNPVRVAEDATCVDILSNGRFDLGIGQGYRAEEFAALKLPRPSARRAWPKGSSLFGGCGLTSR